MVKLLIVVVPLILGALPCVLGQADVALGVVGFIDNVRKNISFNFNNFVDICVKEFNEFIIENDLTSQPVPDQYKLSNKPPIMGTLILNNSTITGLSTQERDGRVISQIKDGIVIIEARFFIKHLVYNANIAVRTLLSETYGYVRCDIEDVLVKTTIAIDIQQLSVGLRSLSIVDAGNKSLQITGNINPILNIFLKNIIPPMLENSLGGVVQRSAENIINIVFYFANQMIRELGMSAALAEISSVGSDLIPA